MEEELKHFTRFKINAPKVIHENFDDEAVIINLDTGSYYSFDSIGANVWNLIGTGSSFAEITQRIAQAYQGDGSAIESSLRSFIEELKKEALIISLDATEDAVPNAVIARAAITSEIGKPVFKAPSMQKFTDMQDLLLLDPIHDVDERGWPSTRRGPL